MKRVGGVARESRGGGRADVGGLRGEGRAKGWDESAGYGVSLSFFFDAKGGWQWGQIPKGMVIELKNDVWWV